PFGAPALRPLLSPAPEGLLQIESLLHWQTFPMGLTRAQKTRWISNRYSAHNSLTPRHTWLQLGRREQKSGGHVERGFQTLAVQSDSPSEPLTSKFALSQPRHIHVVVRMSGPNARKGSAGRTQPGRAGLSRTQSAVPPQPRVRGL